MNKLIYGGFMKFMQAKAVLCLMLLFLSLSVFADSNRKIVRGVPVIEYSTQRMGVGHEVTYYIYRYKGPYGGRYFVSTIFSLEKNNCVLDNNDKCKGFDAPELALKEAIKLSEEYKDDYGYEKGITCKVDEVDFVVNCGYYGEGKDNTGGDGSDSQGTGSPVDNGNGNSNTDNNPKPTDPNQCGRTLGGVWVPMPCDKVQNDTPTDTGGNSGNSSGGGDSGNGSGGSSEGSDEGGSDSGNGNNNNNGSENGNTDYVPPKEPECSSNSFKDMCGGSQVVSHGSKFSGYATYSCMKKKSNGQPEYYNFWVVPLTQNAKVLYCDGSAYVETQNGGNITINVYNNYNSSDEANEATKDNTGSTDDIYDKFDRDRINKERERDRDRNNSGNNAASQAGGNQAGGNQGGNQNAGGVGGGNGSASGVADGQCEEGKDILGCVPVGSDSDVDKAIDDAIGGIGEGDFGIKEKEVNINTFKKGSDFVESGTCPPPKTVVILKTTHQISYQQFCDVAIKIRPIVIFMAMFVAFAIVYIAILNKD